MRAAPILATLCAPAVLAGCGMDKKPVASEATRSHPSVDPLFAATVGEPLMSDQQLSYQANLDAVRPPDIPLSAPIPPIDVVPAGPIEAATSLPAPLAGPCDACRIANEAVTLGALAERLNDPAARACAPAIRYSALWATRLPADLPLPSAARVLEAAGSDGPACRLRLVAYGAAVPVATLFASEYARASRAGYAVTYGTAGDVHALSGRRPRDGSTLTLVARDIDGIADARLVMAQPR